MRKVPKSNLKRTVTANAGSGMALGHLRYVAFLRGINLGNRRVAMSTLRELFEQLGLDRVATFIASGNVLFSTRPQDASALEQQIARHLESALGYPVDTFVRTLKAVAAVAQAAEVPNATAPGNTVHVGFLKAPLTPDIAQRLGSVRTEHDAFYVCGSEIYWMCRIRTSDSLVWRSPEMKALKLPTMTLRNLTSVRKLIAQHPPE